MVYHPPNYSVTLSLNAISQHTGELSFPRQPANHLTVKYVQSPGRTKHSKREMKTRVV